MLAASPRAPLASLSNRENLISPTMGNKSALNKVPAPPPPKSQLNNPLEKVTVPGTIPLQELQLIALIGEGGFGSVYSGIDNKYGEVAVKICNIGDSADVEDVAHEISIHRKLQPRDSLKEGMHVQFYYHIEQPTRSLIVMELIKGVDLEDYAALRPHGRLEESEARAIAFPFLKAIEYFHSHGVAHLDIKPTNLLIDQNGCPRLIDYGSSAIFAGREGLVIEQGGTDNYKAPERHEATADEEFCGPAADMFSAGCTIFFMLAGHDAYDWATASSCDEIMDRIEERDVPFDRCQPPIRVSSAAKEMILNCLTWEPLDRLTAAQALMHQWFAASQRCESADSINELATQLRRTSMD